MKIGLFTSSRSDFGLIKNLILILKKEKINYKLIVSGSHFSKKYGETIKEIKKNNIIISKKIKGRFSANTTNDLSKSFSLILNTLAKEISKLNIDRLVLLGDRFETLAAAVAAYINKICIIHLHGGEITQGSMDETFRHSITKFSHLHFVANEIYKKRVIQLGENPKKVFNVGGLGIDSISKTNLFSKDFLSKKFKINFKKRIFIITFHPETLSIRSLEIQVSNLLLSLKKINNTTLIFTSPGVDMGNSYLIKSIIKFVKNNENCFFIKSLGQDYYFSFLNISDLMIGNSSSGILEMPYFKKPTINIGSRQSGRLKSKSVIDVKNINKTSLDNAIRKATSKKFLNTLKNLKSPYGKPGASLKIYKLISKDNVKNVSYKKFYDWNFKFNF